jgi:hypothetical protein
VLPLDLPLHPPERNRSAPMSNTNVLSTTLLCPGKKPRKKKPLDRLPSLHITLTSTTHCCSDVVTVVFIVSHISFPFTSLLCLQRCCKSSFHCLQNPSPSISIYLYIAILSTAMLLL